MENGLKEPVLRCLSCHALLTRKTITKMGRCNKCGMRRVTTVQMLSDTEKEELLNKGVDKAWIDEFCQEVPDE